MTQTNDGGATDLTTDALCAVRALVRRLQHLDHLCVRAKHLGLKEKPRVPVGGWAALKFKRLPGGRVVPR